MKQIFESDNIRFVEVSYDLLKDYLGMINDLENVGRFIGRRTEPFTVEQETEWIRENLEARNPVFSLIEKKSGEFIGNIELMDVKGDMGELGIGLTAGKQDQGYGTEAIKALLRYARDVMGIRRVFLKAYPENLRAIHVYEKCGFREYDRTDEDVFMEIYLNE
ncbi:MAG: GNAT family N-acetyltransferase [Erysipelotrichaceae bacterium]|nr:GNAT family N-acetyltransferase [Erysipelotrichaceae bacterium]